MAHIAGLGLAGVASAAGAAGTFLFNYNRGYYRMDQKLHFSRFSCVNNQAVAQTNQYRQDIADLTDLTALRAIKYQDVAAVCLTALTAFFCPGRVGLHTPPPPSWLMGLFHTNLAGAYMWAALTIWLGLYAGLRADAASVHMLTRTVRVPVPNQKMLDKARKLLSSYEEQPWHEIFRIPFVMKHGYSRGAGGYNEQGEIDEDMEARTRHGNDVPAWFKKERLTDHQYAYDTMSSQMPYSAKGSAPEHFEVYREVQNEWWPYDVYCRIAMFLMQMHANHAWGYYQMGHQLQETRALWACCILLLALFASQQVLITMDIDSKFDMIPVHRLGPFGLFTGFLGAIMEYKRWYTAWGIALTGIFVYITYLIHIVYTLALIALCHPDLDAPPLAAEAPGAAWWPSHWRLPSAFSLSVFLVAPPQHLEADQVDLPGQMRELSGYNSSAYGGGAPLSPRSEKRRDVHRALGKMGESPAWQIVYIGLLAMVGAWVWLTIGFTIDIANQGTTHPSLLSAPGIPNNLRDPRYRPAKPGYPKPQEVGTGGYEAGPAAEMLEVALEEGEAAGGEASEHGEHHDGDGHLRRLSASGLPHLVSKLHDLLPYLHQLAHGSAQGLRPPSAHVASVELPLGFGTGGATVRARPRAVAAAVRWPALFEPRLLACAPAGHGTPGLATVAALSRYGRGAIISASAEGRPAAVGDAERFPAGEATLPFALEGASSFGPLLAASWDEAGLLLVTLAGRLLDCPSAAGRPPAGGRWRCRALDVAKLPLGLGKQPFAGAVAVARLPPLGGAGAGQDGALSSSSPALRAAVVFPGETTVTIFSRTGRAAAPWLPAGEARTHAPVATAVFAAGGADSLFLSSADGAVARMSLADGELAPVADAVGVAARHEWQAMCGLSGQSEGLARLALRSMGELSWDPVLFLGV